MEDRAKRMERIAAEIARLGEEEQLRVLQKVDELLAEQTNRKDSLDGSNEKTPKKE
jgi:hypothetical protein